jgi:two-component system, chemotaxis family, protein-glutamate methylesterase/glutaminase
MDGGPGVRAARKIRVLIVDDSSIVRKILAEALADERDLEVVGTAPDAFVARDKILSLDPDVITLDLEMPGMDGLTFLKKLMSFHPLPAIVVSSLAQPSCRTALEALSLGAVDVMAKPGGPYSVGELRRSLASKIRAAAAARLRFHRDSDPSRPLSPLAGEPVRPGGFRDSMVIAIGASTGGTEAIAEMLCRFPACAPAVAIVQHIPAEFSRAFAARLNQKCAMEVREAQDGDLFQPGLALVAPGDFHMVVERRNGQLAARVRGGPQVCYQRPSVDVLFVSAAEAAGARAIGVLLTGMGSDGARGLLRMRQAGARTIAQDEATSVVYGMPREAVKLGAAERVLPLSAIPAAIFAGSTVPSPPTSPQRAKASASRCSASA